VKKKTTQKKPDGMASGKGKRTGMWLVVVFLMSAWMFIVGLLVGRGTAPVHFDLQKLQNEIAELRKGTSEKKAVNGGKIKTKMKEKTDLEFYEALKKKTAPPPVKPAEGEKSKKVKPSERKASPSEKKVLAEKMQRAPTEKKAPKDSAKKKSNGKLTIQVAALKDDKVAQQLVDRLKKKGYSAYRASVNIPGKGVWYRIRIGSYQTRADAARTLKRLKKDGLDGFLVKK
jgi:cell division septation protein DedD